MNDRKLLTVAIPTYNRPGPLEEILVQLAKEKNQDFTILIADDSSTNDVEKIVKRYRAKLKNITYHKNNKNLGFSGNVCNLYELAKTRYIWYLCDDDTVLPGAIDHIIDAIKLYKPTVAVFNCTWINVYGEKVQAGVSKDVLYTKLSQFHRYTPLQRMTYLSIIVLEKSLAIDSIKQTNYKDNIFFQMTLGLYLLNHRLRYVEVSQRIVHRNVGYKYGEFFKFNLVDHMKAVEAIPTSFRTNKFVDWTISALPSFFLLYLSQKVGLFTYYGSPTQETRKLLVKYYGFYTIFIFLFVVIYYCVPAVILKTLYRLRLIQLHGSREGNTLYNKNVNRAFTDERKTAFTSYR